MHAVSFIIPTYNGLHLLQKHLSSVFAAARKEDEVVIIDDASHDDTKKWLITTYELVQQKQQEEYEVWANSQKRMMCIFNAHNLRFAASCNRAVELCSHELVLLLNNDVTPHADILQFLVPYFDQKDTFAVGCLEHEGDVLSGKKKLWFEHGLFVHSKDMDMVSSEMDWVSGGSGIFDKKKWVELKGFDPDFAPAYWEDVDISYRARKKGWKIFFEKRAEVDHQHESTNNDVFGEQKMKKMSWVNGQKFVWKNGSIGQKIQFLLWKPYWWWQWSKQNS